jgi:hypothetical protein
LELGQAQDELAPARVGLAEEVDQRTLGARE